MDLLARPLLLAPFAALALAALVFGWRAHRRPGVGIVVVGQKPLLQSVGLAVGLLGLGLGLAGPRWGLPESPRLTVQVLLDASKSMRVQDANGRSRFDAATAFLDRLWAEPVPGVRYGLDALTGDLVPLLPPGEDRTLLRETLRALQPGAFGSPGSSFGRGMEQAVKSVDASGPAVLVLLSDGEETWESEGDALARGGAALKQAKLPLYTVVFGSPTPSPVPVNPAEAAKEAAAIAAQGEPPTSAARPAFLKGLAEASGGKVLATPEELRALLAELCSGKRPLPARRSLQPVHPELGAWIALLGLALWLVAAGKPLAKWRPVLALVAALLAFPAQAQPLPQSVKAWLAQRALDSGDLPGAQRWKPSGGKPLHALLAAEIELRSGFPEDALKVLAPLTGQGAPRPLPAWRAPALLLAARAEVERKKPEAAKALLERLLLEQPGQADAVHDLQSLVQDPTPPPPPDPHRPPPPPPPRPSMGAQKDELEGRLQRLPLPKQAPKGVKDL
ncbi:MAG TPA: VWA domain-containing protein [Holophagaceae bacterium]|nr:VWA domain-containing protein [Holophagaceae bacterium]